MEQNPWKTIDSREVYRNPWISVREDSVITPAGEAGIYGVVQPKGLAIGIVALTEKREIYLVGQYRYAMQEYSWELPEGGGEPGEEALATAKRELREETGIIAQQWASLGGAIHLSNSFTNERGALFLAQNLSQVEDSPESTEVLCVRCVPFEECLQMVDSGEIKDSLTIIGVLRAQRLLSASDFDSMAE